jgi:hypothetical protein
MAGLGARAWIAVSYEPDDVFLQINPEVAARQDFVGLGVSGVAKSWQGMVLLNQLGF